MLTLMSLWGVTLTRHIKISLQRRRRTSLNERSGPSPQHVIIITMEMNNHWLYNLQKAHPNLIPRSAPGLSGFLNATIINRGYDLNCRQNLAMIYNMSRMINGVITSVILYPHMASLFEILRTGFLLFTIWKFTV